KLRALPANHSPRYLPSVRLTLETGTAALVTGALARLGRGPDGEEVRPTTARDDTASGTGR
ncbi:hypothetical protein AB0D38_22265, partial [Streptomyces sp. NPDC048279]|uniref:hypothetical protein n=1 Tax=Streptomyces sp. NPDC048279 TaxID=3154714 RepID=UPI003420F7F7